MLARLSQLLSHSAIAGVLAILCWLVLFGLAYLTATIGLHSLIIGGLFPADPVGQATGRVGTFLVLSCIGMLSAAIVTTASLAKERSLRASKISIVALGGLILGWALFLGPLWPESFVFYVGADRYRIPWGYSPQGRSSPGGESFSFKFCPDQSAAVPGGSCQRPRRVSVGHHNCFHERSFRTYHLDMVRLQPIFGHEVFLHSQIQNSSTTKVSKYYVRRLDAGAIARVVRCDNAGRCEQQVPLAEYTMCYTSDERDIEAWREMDRRISTLVQSWRLP